MTDRPLVAVVVFPGSNDDHDAAWALGAVGAEPVLVWHQDLELPRGTGAVVLPGGFSYGDYLRTGAIASVAPVLTSARYGDPGYCQLADRSAAAVREGADDESEIGAFHHLQLARREAQSAKAKERRVS